jgi:serine/threonine protein kinase
MKVIEIECFNQERIRAFKQEQKIYKSITGGFNVKLYYSFSVNNLYFLILDYGCGGSFRQLLEK